MNENCQSDTVADAGLEIHTMAVTPLAELIVGRVNAAGKNAGGNIPNLEHVTNSGIYLWRAGSLSHVMFLQIDSPYTVSVGAATVGVEFTVRKDNLVVDYGFQIIAAKGTA